MNPEALTALSPLLDALADALAPRIAARMGETVNNPNELLSIAQIAKEFRMSPRSVRNLIDAGTLHRSPDIRVKKVKRSVVDAYGKPPAK